MWSLPLIGRMLLLLWNCKLLLLLLRTCRALLCSCKRRRHSHCSHWPSALRYLPLLLLRSYKSLQLRRGCKIMAVHEAEPSHSSIWRR